MLGPLDHLIARSALDALPGVHHQRIFGEIARAGDIVRDKEQRQVLFVFQAQQQIQHIKPNRDIQHGYRFVCQQHFRARCQRTRDRHALALSPAQLVRKLGNKLLGWTQAHTPQQRENLLSFLGFVMRMTMNAQWAAQMIAHIMHRIERRKWVLEYQLHVATIGFDRERTLHLLSSKDNASRCWLIEPRQQTRYRRFATPAFSYQRQCTARIERERGILNCMDDTLRAKQLDAPHRKIFAQMHRFQDWRNRTLLAARCVWHGWKIDSSLFCTHSALLAPCKAS